MSEQANRSKIAASIIIPLIPILLLLCSFGSFNEQEYVSEYATGRDKALIKKHNLTITRKLPLLAAYAAGKACLNEDYTSNASIYLTTAASQLSELQDYALFYAAKALLKEKKQSAALQQYTTLIKNHPNSIFYPKALSQAIKLNLRAYRYNSAYTLLQKAIKHSKGWKKQHYQLQTAKIELQRGQKQKALRLLYKILHANNSPSLMAAAWRLLKIKTEASPSTTLKKLYWARGAVAAGKTKIALRILHSLRRQSNKKNIIFESTLDTIWALKKRSNWHRAHQLAISLSRKPWLSKKQLHRVYRHLFKLYTQRRILHKALTTAIKIARIAPRKSSALFIILTKLTNYGSPFYWQCNLKALQYMPKHFYFQDNLLITLAHYFSRKQYQRVIRLGKSALSKITYSRIKAGIFYFLHRSAQALNKNKDAIQFAREAIYSEPLGNYHNLITKNRRYSFLKKFTIPTDTKINRLCRLFFIAQKSTKIEILNRLKKSSAYPSQLFQKNQDFEINNWTSTIQQTDKLQFLIKNKLYRDAYTEIKGRLRTSGKKFSNLSIQQLQQIASLTQSAHLYSSTIYICRILLAKLGWGKETAILEKTVGNTVLTILYPQHFRKSILETSRYYRLDPKFILALIRQESSFNATIHSWAGAIGLMQLMPSTAAGIAAKLKIEYADLHNPATNLHIGCNFLKWLKRKFKKNEYALIGYNAGPNRIKQWKRVYRRRYRNFDLPAFCELIPFRETRDYIKQVQSNLLVYNFLY